MTGLGGGQLRDDVGVSWATHYEVLGVDRDASHEEIRSAFRRQARLHHPDAEGATPAPGGPLPGDIHHHMVAITEAWETLGDPQRRAAYDAALAGPTTASPPPQAPSGDDLDDLSHLVDDPLDLAPTQARPADLLVATPVALVVLALACLWFSVMWRVTALRTAAFLLVPLAVAGFVAAPLFAMLRARRRPGHGSHRQVPDI